MSSSLPWCAANPTLRNLLQRILEAYDRCGLVGEETNKLITYLTCVSRLLERPLAVLIQSPSAAGKTSLLNATLSFMPPEDRVEYSALTGRALYYMGETDLRHKILAISEEEGMAEAAYALRLLQSDGRLTIATAEREGDAGRQRTREYTVEGPVAMLLSTTAEAPDAERISRFFVIHVNEQPEQTAAIHRRQREAYTFSGAATDSEKIRRLHENAQRLLEPLGVVIPWAEELTFLVPLPEPADRPRWTDSGAASKLAPPSPFFQEEVCVVLQFSPIDNAVHLPRCKERSVASFVVVIADQIVQLLAGLHQVEQFDLRPFGTEYGEERFHRFHGDA